MDKEISINQSNKQFIEADSLNLPIFSQNSELTLSEGKIFPVAGTNVVKVPFGVRVSKKKKPQIPDRIATLVLPFQATSTPTPPPNAA